MTQGLALLRVSVCITTLTLLWTAAWIVGFLGEEPGAAPEVGDEGSWYAELVTLAGMLGGCMTGWRSLGRVARAAEEAERDDQEDRCCPLAERAAELERQRHEFFNELTVVSALLQMGAYERARAYIGRILAMRRPERAAGAEAAADLFRKSPEGGMRKSKGVDPDPCGIVGLLVATEARACQEGIRFHMRVTVDRTDREEVDRDLIGHLAHLLEQSLDRARAAHPDERLIDVGFIREAREDRIEVWVAAAPYPNGPDGGWDLERIRSWVAEVGGTVQVEVPPRGGTLVRVILPVREPVP